MTYYSRPTKTQIEAYRDILIDEIACKTQIPRSRLLNDPPPSRAAADVDERYMEAHHPVGNPSERPWIEAPGDIAADINTAIISLMRTDMHKDHMILCTTPGVLAQMDANTIEYHGASIGEILRDLNISLVVQDDLSVDTYEEEVEDKWVWEPHGDYYFVYCGPIHFYVSYPDWGALMQHMFDAGELLEDGIWFRVEGSDIVL